jgi:hypothetical protein
MHARSLNLLLATSNLLLRLQLQSTVKPKAFWKTHVFGLCSLSNVLKTRFGKWICFRPHVKLWAHLLCWDPQKELASITFDSNYDIWWQKSMQCHDWHNQWFERNPHVELYHSSLYHVNSLLSQCRWCFVLAFLWGIHYTVKCLGKQLGNLQSIQSFSDFCPSF